MPYITQSGDFLNGNIGEAVRFLGLNNSEVLKMHFEINLGNDALLRITTLIIVFCLAFFYAHIFPLSMIKIKYWNVINKKMN